MNPQCEDKGPRLLDFPSFVRGDTMPVIALKFKNVDRCEVEVPVAVTVGIRGRMHKDAHSLPVSISGDGEVVIGGWGHEQTRSLQPQTYDYDVVFEFENGRVLTLLKGSMLVLDRVTP